MARFLLALAPLALAACSQVAAPVQPTPSIQGTSQSVATRTAPDVANRCRGANWRATGYRHGLSGFPLDTISDLSKACEEAGIKIDRLAYSTGRLEGLGTFCTTENGYRRALAGHPAQHNCPPSLAKAFEDGHAAGVRAR